MPERGLRRRPRTGDQDKPIDFHNKMLFLSKGYGNFIQNIRQLWETAFFGVKKIITNVHDLACVNQKSIINSCFCLGVGANGDPVEAQLRVC